MTNQGRQPAAAEGDRATGQPSRDLYEGFPGGFFSRVDEGSDAGFFEQDRFVTHIDDHAIAAVGRLYERLGLDGRILDLMSSWISHFLHPPTELIVLGMNERELRANTMAAAHVVHDLNVDQRLPFDDDRFDAATCCVSVDYLVRPIDVLRDTARVVCPGGVVVSTFSNRCFPTKVIRGWLALDESERCALVGQYFERAGGYADVQVARCTPIDAPGDPLFAVWGTVT